MTGLIVHEWIEKIGGSENVLKSMCNLFPESEIFCLWNNALDGFVTQEISQSILSRTPLRGRKALALPLMPSVWRKVPSQREYEWMLVSSHAFAHHARLAKQPNIDKFVYVHSPARYLWAPELDLRGQGLHIKAIAPYFKRLDRQRANSGAHLAANSKYIAQRIADSWQREATVVYPPVDTTKLQSKSRWIEELSDGDAAIMETISTPYVFGASRFVAYKQLDAVIRAGEVAGIPVVIAGAGPDLERLQQLGREARVPVTIIERPSDRLLYALYQEASVFIFLAVEDFGIMPVEAMALGTPVVVNSVGGAVESAEIVGAGVTVPDLSDSSLGEAVESALALDMNSAPSRAAENFGELAFHRNLKSWMDLKMGEDLIAQSKS